MPANECQVLRKQDQKLDFSMALYYYSLPVYRDMYKLVLKIFEITQGFSHEYKYTLCIVVAADKK